MPNPAPVPYGINYTVLGTITDLPGDLYWEDELTWSSVGMTSAYSCKGHPIYQYSQVQGGRPITLRSPDGSRGFFTRKNIKDLQVLANTPAAEYELTLSDGRTFTVIFDLERSSPFEFDYKMFLEIPTDDQHFTGTIYLREVVQGP